MLMQGRGGGSGERRGSGGEESEGEQSGIIREMSLDRKQSGPAGPIRSSVLVPYV